MDDRVNINSLKEIFESIISNIELEYIDINFPYYWSISDEDIYDLDKKPDVKELGDMFEDWKQLKDIHKSHDFYHPYMLSLFCGILRYISTMPRNK